jgi:hypothetical protein
VPSVIPLPDPTLADAEVRREDLIMFSLLPEYLAS